MAEGTEPMIELRVLSPSTEVQTAIVLDDLPASTTVKDLRLRIQAELASRPATDRMRLIYRGRVVADDGATLTDVFGIDNIRSSREQTLHLVLRELPGTSSDGSSIAPTSAQSASPAPRSQTAPPNPFRHPQLQTPPQTNPFRPLGQPRPNSQPQTPQPQGQLTLQGQPLAQGNLHAHPHHHHHHHHHHNPQHQPQQPPNLGNIALPPAVNSVIQQQIAQALAHNHGQLAALRSPQPTANTPVPANGGQPTPATQSPTPRPGAHHTNSTRSIRTETVGPNGERVTVTWNTNITIPALPNPSMQRPLPQMPAPANLGNTQPPAGPPGHGQLLVDQLLGRARLWLQTARSHMDNISLLVRERRQQMATEVDNPLFPQWRLHHIQNHVQALNQALEQVQLSLDSLRQDASTANNREFILLQNSTNELRSSARQVTGLLGDLMNIPGRTGAPPSSNNDSAPTQTQPQQQQQNSTAPSTPATPELFILSSPQGPVGILFDQRGTYSTAPVTQTMPFQAFRQQFATNRQRFAATSYQVAQNTAQIHNRLNNQQAHNTQPAANAQPAPDQPAQANQNQNQNQNANQAAPPPPADNDRVAMWAGHGWLIVKLAIFIYLFAGNGSWYRPMMLGIVGFFVYLAQIGVLDNQFQQIRHHFEALLPLNEHAAQQPAGQEQQPQQPVQASANGANQQRLQPNRNLTPEQAAQRLMQQHQDQHFGWVRQSVRGVERALALFVASLWPGIGERMVQAQEDRARAERAAEEERERAEEERRAREQAEKEAAEAGVEAGAEASSGEKDTSVLQEQVTEDESSAKGKERAVEVESGDAEAASSWS